MAPPTKVAKASRITIACNACRFRKQKCGGKKPVCTQCLQHNRICDWPEQLKRGPAKGYIESLEHRLHETENVLLKVLSHVPDAQLSASIAHDQQHRSRSGNMNLLYSPFPRLGKRGTEYWSKFPLDTAHNIREWQRDCLSHGRSGPDNQRLGLTTRRSSEHKTGLQSPRIDITRNTTLESRDPHEPSEYPSSDTSVVDMHTRQCEGSGVSLSPKTISPLSRNGSIGAGEGRSGKAVQLSPRRSTVSQGTSYMPQPQPGATEGPNSIPQAPNSWSGAPSINFQHQFLW